MGVFEFSQARSEVNGVVRYEPIVFPVWSSEDGLTDYTGTALDFHRYGISYLSYHLQGGTSKYKELLADKDFKQLGELINLDYAKLGYEKPLIAASFKGRIVGVMRRYVPIFHSDLLEMVAKSGLVDSFHGYFLSMTEFRMYFNVTTKIRPLVTLQVRNGHSGHIAFSYSGRFNSFSYEFLLPLVDHVKHFSTASAVLHNLKDIMDGVRDLEIEQRLRDIPIVTVKRLIDSSLNLDEETKSMQNLLSAVFEGKPETALEFLVLASTYSGVHGYKGAVKKVNDLVMISEFGESGEEYAESK